MIVIDTTVLVYAVGADHALRGPCQELVERAAAGEVSLAVTIEVLQEFAHVRARRCGRVEAAALAREWTHLACPVLRPDEEDLLVGLNLWEEHPDLGCFDAILAATALRNADGLLASADRSFGDVAGLTWLDPARGDFIARCIVSR